MEFLENEKKELKKTNELLLYMILDKKELSKDETKVLEKLKDGKELSKDDTELLKKRQNAYQLSQHGELSQEWKEKSRYIAVLCVAGAAGAIIWKIIEQFF